MRLPLLARISVTAYSSCNISKTPQHVHIVLWIIVCWNPSWLVLPLMHEQKKTYIECLTPSNRTLWKSIGDVIPLQQLLVLYTIMSCIPNVLNYAIDFLNADHIILVGCKYKDIESSTSYYDLSTGLFDVDTLFDHGGINYCSLLSNSVTDMIYNLVQIYIFCFPEGLSRVLSNRVHDLFSNYQ